MANQVIKKFKTPLLSLPPISSITEGYSLRYKIVSSDKNRTSHWSPVYLIQPEYTFVPGSIGLAASAQVAAFTWDSVLILKSTDSSSTISNKVLSSNIVTLTTTSAHYFNVGDWVTVSGVHSTFNGTFEISAVTVNTFSYYKNSGNVGSVAVSPSGTYKKNIVIGDAPDYDIWLRFDRNDSGDWRYKERTQRTDNSFTVPTTYTINGAVQSLAPNKVSIEIYLKGHPIERDDGTPLDVGTPFLKVYQLLNQSL